MSAGFDGKDQNSYGLFISQTQSSNSPWARPLDVRLNSYTAAYEQFFIIYL